MTGAIVITWGAPVRGRELKGLEVFGEALATMSGLAKQGRIHGHREYFAATGNATELNGMQVIDGNVDELQRLLVEPEFQALIAKASAIVDNFTVTLTIGGTDQSIQQRVTLYTEALQTLGYV